MSQEINSLETLLHEELKDMYDMEKQLTKALPKMAKKASSEELKRAIEEHLEVTNHQVQRLEQIFENIGQPVKGKTCDGMKGIIAEGKDAMDQDATEPFSDAAIIAAAQRVEHYEIAAYGTARTWAELLGNSEVSELLQETLDEEKEADEKLTEICENLLEGHTGNEEAETNGRKQPMRISSTARRGAARPGMQRRVS